MYSKTATILAGALFLLPAAGCGGHGSPAGGGGSVAPAGSSSAGEGSGTAETPRTAQKTCPVMGNPIDPDIFVDYEGRRIYFCCKACIPAFKKNPARYLKVVDAESTGGK